MKLYNNATIKLGIKFETDKIYKFKNLPKVSIGSNYRNQNENWNLSNFQHFLCWAKNVCAIL